MKVEVVLTDLPASVKAEDCVAVIAPIYVTEKADLASERNARAGQRGTDGRIHITYRCEATMWIWQRRPSSLRFHLFLPRIQTNGWYYLSLPELPRKPAPVQGFFQDYETWWQYYPLPNPLPTLPITAEATRSRKFADGYKVVLQVPVAKLPTTTDLPRRKR